MPLSQENTLHIWPCGNCALTNYHILTNAIKQNVAKSNTQQQNVQKNDKPLTSWLTVCIMPVEKVCNCSTAYQINNEEQTFHFK